MSGVKIWKDVLDVRLKLSLKSNNNYHLFCTLNVSITVPRALWVPSHLILAVILGVMNNCGDFTDEETEARRGKGPCLRTQSWQMAEPGLELLHSFNHSFMC